MITIGDPNVSGLNDGQIYYVIHDPASPETIRLALTEERAFDGLAVDIVSLGTGTQRLGIENPRVAQLATTLHDESEIIELVDLDASTASGSQHSFTSTLFGGFTEVLFDPNVAIDSDLDLIVLPAGHGFINEQVVTYRSGAGPKLTITARGEEDSFADSSGRDSAC